LHGGLTDEDPSPGRGTPQAVITAASVLAALALFVSACGTGGTGTRDEGPASLESSGSDMVAGAAPSPSPSASLTKTQAAELVQDDPSVSAEVKNGLKPCVGDEYPVDVAYGDLTGGSSEDIVVTVLTCADVVGIGSYVYREQKGAYENVFSVEESPVYADIDSSGDLVVTKQVYEKGDPVSSPSGDFVIVYRWKTDRFVKWRSWHNEYSDVGPTPTPVPAS
jgi:hypothetical protein